MQERPGSEQGYAVGLRSWIDATARRLRAGQNPPATRAEALRLASRVREQMRRAEGEWPREKAPLRPELLGTLERNGYRIEKLIFQTRPGCCATAHAYVPAGRGPFPAVLCVHGHWQGARRDPTPQARCIGLAKLGFFVLTLDAWGAGERGTEPGVNEYHGGLLGASLWPVSTPLHGLQLYDNVRALDYLESRPEVDRRRIGCTGASGGGNQTTYLSAFDPRVRCAVPVCSVGTFESYLRAACCVDEVLRGGLTFAEEGDLLGMVAPRALMVITASKDVYHFGPEAARTALDRARPAFAAHEASDRVRHVVVDSGHDYNQPMREAMYGWMKRWLADEGDGSPVPEPPVQPEDPETLRCFPPSARPERVMTTVRFVRQRAEALAAAVPQPKRAADWPRERDRRLTRLREILALPGPKESEWSRDGRALLAEPGLPIPVERRAGRAGTVLLLHPGGRARAVVSELAKAVAGGGAALAVPELRGCGELTLPGQALGEAIPDHNLVEWSLWIGRPLLGQWVHDTLQLARRLRGESPQGRLALVGWGEAGLAALLAAALDPEIAGVAAIEAPATYVTDRPPHAVRMVAFQPDLLQVGDIPHLAALAAPRPVLLANPMRLYGAPVMPAELESLFAWPRELWGKLGAADRFTAKTGLGSEALARQVAGWLRVE
ncbi:MAG: alpha/beta hydrolase family protein [Armatimonadota bacterium]